MYLRLYTMIEQILPQGITLWTQNWENMPYTVSVASGDMYQWIVHLINIYGGNLPSDSISLFQMAKLHVEHCRLYLIHATIPANMIEDIFLSTPIVAERSYQSGQRLVVGSYSPGIA